MGQPRMLLCFDDDDVDDDSDDDCDDDMDDGRPLHCLIKPTQVAVVLRRLHVALAKAGPRLRRYEM